MKGITTIASIPSGAGQAAHLPAEVRDIQRAEPFAVYGTVRTADAAFAHRAFVAGYDVKNIPGGWDITNGREPAPKYKPGDVVSIYFGGKLVQTGLVIKSIRDGHVECERLPTIDPDMLGTSTPADKQGFEPFEYSERS